MDNFHPRQDFRTSLLSLFDVESCGAVAFSHEIMRNVALILIALNVKTFQVERNNLQGSGAPSVWAPGEATRSEERNVRGMAGDETRNPGFALTTMYPRNFPFSIADRTKFSLQGAAAPHGMSWAMCQALRTDMKMSQLTRAGLSKHP